MNSIYVLVDPRDQTIRYVGITAKPLEQRLIEHLREINRRKIHSHRKHWIALLARRGYRPIILPLQTVEDDDRWEAERYWIRYYRDLGCRLVNNTDGGEGVVGYRHSATTRQRLVKSSARRGNPSPMLGRKHSAEAREKIRQASLGNTAALGRKHSDDARLKMRVSSCSRLCIAVGKPCRCGQHGAD
jgi:group I intron endonuclease